MNGTDEQTHPFWYSSRVAEESRAPLTRDISADVCVIGAGIAGLATAYQLSLDGAKVVVIDAGSIGSGETGRSSAHLASAVDDRFYRIEALHGAEASRLCYESHAAAIDWFESTAASEGIECEFTRLEGYLFLPLGESVEVIERELEAARRAGVKHLRSLARAPLPHFDTGPCIRFPRQAQCDPLAFVRGLAEAAERRGVQIHEGMHVDRIEDQHGLVVHCEGGSSIYAGAVVVATNSPINNIVTLHTKQFAHRSYVVAMALPRDSLPMALFWDTSAEAGQEGGAYHYVRQHSARRVEDRDTDEMLLIVGGEDHRTGQSHEAEQPWQRLEEWARERFPVKGSARYRWSGQIMEPVDLLAFIGRNPTGPDNTYVITGDSGMGMTHGAIGGMLITDLIAGRSNAWEKLYDPSRISLRAAASFARENINTAVQYADWMGRGDVDSTDEIAPGEGALVRQGLRMLACYRDPAGVLHEYSAACPHLAGVVQWNCSEHTWDCPCHGSRFDAYGHVLNGPAVSPLAEVHEHEKEPSQT